MMRSFLLLCSLFLSIHSSFAGPINGAEFKRLSDYLCRVLKISPRELAEIHDSGTVEAKAKLEKEFKAYANANRVEFSLSEAFESHPLKSAVLKALGGQSEAVLNVAEAPVIIIGGGPAGLSLGLELQKLGIQFIILEKGTSVGQSWKSMPDNLKLLSPWHANSLREGPETSFGKYDKVPAEDFAAYLRSFQEMHGFPVSTETQVFAVQKVGSDNFIITTNRGVYRSNVVLNATGYFSNPNRPHFSGDEATLIPRIHSASYKNPDQLRNIIAQSQGREVIRPKALIIGARIFAGQLVEELHQAGFEVVISYRRDKIEFAGGVDEFVNNHIGFFETLPEWFCPKWDYQPPMEGELAKELITSGTVRKVVDIREYRERQIQFLGSDIAESFDIVVEATGFKPALDHLQGVVQVDAKGIPVLDGVSSAQTPGLFFLGVQFQHSFRSRFLRGIRDEAKGVAKAAAKHLKEVRTP